MHHDMFRSDPWKAALDDNHWSTDTPAVTCNQDRTVVIVDVYAHELAHSTSSTELPEIRHKAGRITRETDDRAVHVNDVGVRPINLRASSKSNI